MVYRARLGAVSPSDQHHIITSNNMYTLHDYSKSVGGDDGNEKWDDMILSDYIRGPDCRFHSRKSIRWKNKVVFIKYTPLFTYF